ncbi:MAG: cyclic nucleotide-binding domain-containing protein [Acidimicrobiia bacterium]|nr:cyclic nucleotide-binding domain-containing protein [Acidimicrobiia bacterium]
MFHKDDRVDPALLGEVPFFADFDQGQLEAISKLGHRREIDAGTAFVEQGRYGLACYVIATGQADVYIGSDWVASIGPGSLVGEMALIEHRPRNATVVATGAMVLVEFGIDEFQKFLTSNPTAEARVLATLNQRIRENTERS